MPKSRTSRHESGKKLHEVARLVLDQKAPAGDSAVWVRWLWKRRSRRYRAFTGCAIINLVKAEVRQAAHRRRALPQGPDRKACHLGPERARQLFEETYDDYRRRVGVLYH